MLYNQIMVRYGDLTLKGKNQKEFLDRVFHLTKLKLKGTDTTIERTHDRMYVKFGENTDSEVVMNRLQLVSGIHSFSPVFEVEEDIDKINEAALKIISELVIKDTTFKVAAKRSDKSFPITSQDIMKVVSAYVLRNSNLLHVDVHNPELTLYVEVRIGKAYLYTTAIPALGGFPVGVAGKGLAMMSGGIDSPVAAFLAMKQGVEVELLHFESTPLTSIESAQKVIDLAKVLAKYSPNNKIKVHMVPFKEIHMALLDNVPESYNITIMRRMMYRIASQYAQKLGILVLINGESVGQVASQTIHSMSVINNVTNMPVLRPVVTYDKNEIIKVSKKIGTFDLSIKPFEDCCTVYVPKNPVIRPDIGHCEAYEKNFDFKSLIEETVDNIKTIDISFDSQLDLTELGLEVREVLE